MDFWVGSCFGIYRKFSSYSAPYLSMLLSPFSFFVPLLVSFFNWTHISGENSLLSLRQIHMLITRQKESSYFSWFKLRNNYKLKFAVTSLLSLNTTWKELYSSINIKFCESWISFESDWHIIPFFFFFQKGALQSSADIRGWKPFLNLTQNGKCFQVMMT